MEIICHKNTNFLSYHHKDIQKNDYICIPYGNYSIYRDYRNYRNHPLKNRTMLRKILLPLQPTTRLKLLTILLPSFLIAVSTPAMASPCRLLRLPRASRRPSAVARRRVEIPLDEDPL